MKNQEKYNVKSLACFYEEYNYIVIRGEYMHDIDQMCCSLSHELIHYLQKNKPFQIDIEDSVVTTILDSDLYKKNSPDELQMEFEAETYDKYPYFINRFKENPNFIKEEFFTSPKRLFTIEWICKNRILPIYPPNSDPLYNLDFQNIKEFEIL